MNKKSSNKKYLTAVILCAVFGVVGIHHFYVERYLMGVLDLTLFVLTIYFCFIQNNPLLFSLGIFLGIIDFIHTIYVTLILLIGEYKDGKGCLITYPNQKI
jgi:hypothetical protein